MNCVAIVGYDAGGLVTDHAHFEQFINGLIGSAALSEKELSFDINKDEHE